MSSSMKWIKKSFLLILMFVVAILALELWREQVVYRRASNTLERGFPQLRQGMSREEVKSILGEPQGAGSSEPDESWYWNAGNYQGDLWELLGLNTAKGHYGIAVIFGGDGKSSKIYGGVN